MSEITKYRDMISDGIYHNLSMAGDLCRQACHRDPDVLNAIADGILRLIGDGDVFEAIIQEMMVRDPNLFVRCLDAIGVDQCQKIIDGILDPTDHLPGEAT